MKAKVQSATPFDLTGKVEIINERSPGTGRAIAAAGAHVVIFSCSQAACQNVADAITFARPRVLGKTTLRPGATTLPILRGRFGPLVPRPHFQAIFTGAGL